MAEILVKASDNFHSDPVKDQACYKRGMPVVVFDDGHEWGAEERLPLFVVIKIPGVPKDHPVIEKYIHVWDDGTLVMRLRRRWQIRWADLPPAARNKLSKDGELTIKAGAYDGLYDYTWDQIKTFFRNNQTGLDETDGI